MIFSAENTKEEQKIKGIDGDGSGRAQIADISATKSESKLSESGNKGWLIHSLDSLQGM